VELTALSQAPIAGFYGSYKESEGRRREEKGEGSGGVRRVRKGRC